MGFFSAALFIINLIFCFPLLVMGGFTCYWATYAWHSPENFDETQFVTSVARHTRFRFSVIVPVRDESYRVMRATIGCLLAQTHPSFQAVLSVGFDDPSTLDNAHRLVAEDPTGRLVVSTSRSEVHNKPTQLNAALQDCDGDIVGLLDAESLSAPDLLAQVDSVFQQTGVSVVQGGVVLTNYRSSWVALRSALEYYAHHRSKMHFSASRNAILMGGNTVFFRRDLLLELEGWDATNLAEDAEISLRLLTLGHRVTVAYDPTLVSREEAPVTMRAWVKQRTRWNLGFLQTITKGVWRRLPGPQRRLALWHLLQPSLMSFTGIAFPLSVASYFLCHPPLALAMLTWLPVAPTVLAVVIECVLLRAFTHEHDNHPARIRDYLKVILSAPVYQVLLAVSALRAGWKYARGEFAWDKTRHDGHHLEDVVIDDRVYA